MVKSKPFKAGKWVRSRYHNEAVGPKLRELSLFHHPSNFRMRRPPVTIVINDNIEFQLCPYYRVVSSSPIAWSKRTFAGNNPVLTYGKPRCSNLSSVSNSGKGSGSSAQSKHIAACRLKFSDES